MVSIRFASLLTFLPALATGIGPMAQEPPGAVQTTHPTEVSGPGRPERVRGHQSEIGGRAYCGVLPGFDPRRFGPGQSGRLSIVLALQSKAVLEPGSEFTLSYEARQGPVRLGEWTRRPARRSKHYSRYADNPVYDETAQIDIPVSVDGGAAHGNYTLRLRMQTVFHDGVSGEVLAQYEDDIPCRLMVGRPLPSPVARIVAPAPTPVEARLQDAVGDRGLSMRAIPAVRLRPGETCRFEVMVSVPAGMHILRDSDLAVPQVGITGLGEGLRFELGPVPTAVAWQGQSIYERAYVRQVTLVAAATARLGKRRAQVSLRYALCDESACYPPAELEQQIDVELTERPADRDHGRSVGGAEPGAGDVERSMPLPDAMGSSTPAWLLGSLAAVVVALGAMLVLRARR